MKKLSEIWVYAGLLPFVLAVSISGAFEDAIRGRIVSVPPQKGPAVTLPKVQNASADAPVINEDSVVLTIPADGEFYLGKSKIEKSRIAEEIRDLLADKPPDEQVVFIKAAAGLSYVSVRDVLNIMRHVGYDRVGFIVGSSKTQGAELIEARIYYDFTKGFKLDPRDVLPPLPPRPEPPRSSAPPPPPPPPPPPASVRPMTRMAEPLPLHMEGLVVEVNSAGSGPDREVALNTRKMPLSNLRPFLSGLLDQQTEGKSVFIKVARDRMYGDLIAVMDESLGAGAQFLPLILDEVEVPRTLPRPVRRPPPVAGGIPGGVPAGLPEEPPKIIRKSGGVLANSAIKRIEASTPPLAKAARVSGYVVVEVTVDEKGNVIAARAISGHPLLKDAAVSAAREWKFSPTQLSGVPVKVIGTLTFHFKE